MKLISLYVSSFGKLKDFSYDFNENFNVIKQDNGWGKTTLATFIKSIFYGLSGGRTRSVSENERLKYKPWNSTEKFGGYVVFEWGGKQYKLERFFGAKDADDTLSLIDLETGKIYPNPENIGKRIFQIDEEGFLSTTYFSQKEFTIKSNTSITAKYNSVCEIQAVETFDDAVKMLEDKAKELKSRGDKGKISEKKQELFDINDKIALANSAGAQLNIMNKSISGLEEETQKLKQAKDELSKKVGEFGEQKALLEKKKNYQELLAKKNKFILDRNNVLARTKGIEPIRQEVVENFNFASEIYSCEKERNEYSIILNNLNSEKQRVTGQNTSKLWLIFLALSALFLIGGVVGLIANQMIIGVISMLVAAVFGAFTMVNFSVSKKKVNQNVSSFDQKILECKKKIEDLSKSISLNKNNLESYLRVYGLSQSDYSVALNTLSDVVNNLALIDERICLVDSLIAEHDISLVDKFDGLSNVSDGEEFNIKLKTAQTEYDQKYAELVRLKNEKYKYAEMYESLPELGDKKTEIAEELDALVEEHRILELTHKFLLKADENLKVKYRAPLKDSLNKYFSLITGKTDGVDIDIDLNVTGVEKEGNKTPEYYSKGYQNMFEICKRFALTDVLFTGEKPFIILDDPFYNLDDEKIKTALDLVYKLSKEYQIIYFVCHESRAYGDEA